MERDVKEIEKILFDNLWIEFRPIEEFRQLEDITRLDTENAEGLASFSTIRVLQVLKSILAGMLYGETFKLRFIFH